VPPKYSRYDKGGYHEDTYKGYAQSFSENNAQVTAVTAEQAAARLAGYYKNEWPPCSSLGQCDHGKCTLQWKHPACCYHDPYQRDQGEYPYSGPDSDSYNDAKASSDPASAQKPAAKISSGGHWESRKFYCWGHYSQ
jgi:hypothetical protein